jgi:hypothetical protein
MKKLRMRKARFVLLYVLFAGTAIAQKADSTSKPVPGPQWGIEVNYSLMSYTESGVIGAGIVHTRKKHAFALGTHIWHQDLFTHIETWSRVGVAFTYSYFPIGSHRMFAPYLFYDLNYGLLASRRDVMLVDGNGNDYNVVREVDNHTLAHHFGLGVRGNIHRKFFAHLALGAGPATYGDVVTLRSRQAAYPDTQTSEHPFTHFEPAYMLRIGIVYQLEGKEWRKKGSAFN